MRLDNEHTGYGLKFVPGSHGMEAPSACTIVIIAGEEVKIPFTQKHRFTKQLQLNFNFR